VVNLKEEIACRGKDMRIIGCEYSEIFIDSPVRSLYVVNCNNCTIYIAACEKIAFVDKCEKIYFTTATNLLRICNTVDSSIYYYGPSPIILTGDNRSVSIGPNNCPAK
jgi:TBCC domain-containing protein 1